MEIDLIFIFFTTFIFSLFIINHIKIYYLSIFCLIISIIIPYCIDKEKIDVIYSLSIDNYLILNYAEIKKNKLNINCNELYQSLSDSEIINIDKAQICKNFYKKEKKDINKINISDLDIKNFNSFKEEYKKNKCKNIKNCEKELEVFSNINKKIEDNNKKIISSYITFSASLFLIFKVIIMIYISVKNSIKNRKKVKKEYTDYTENLECWSIILLFLLFYPLLLKMNNQDVSSWLNFFNILVLIFSLKITSYIFKLPIVNMNLNIFLSSGTDDIIVFKKDNRYCYQYKIQNSKVYYFELIEEITIQEYKEYKEIQEFQDLKQIEILKLKEIGFYFLNKNFK